MCVGASIVRWSRGSRVTVRAGNTQQGEDGGLLTGDMGRDGGGTLDNIRKRRKNKAGRTGREVTIPPFAFDAPGTRRSSKHEQSYRHTYIRAPTSDRRCHVLGQKSQISSHSLEDAPVVRRQHRGDRLRPRNELHQARSRPRG